MTTPSQDVSLGHRNKRQKTDTGGRTCYCCLFVCIGLSGPAHPPKVKYSVSQLLLWLALSAHIQWPSRTSTPSQREIFSLTAVIVACSYGVSFQDQHTLPKKYSLSQLLLWLVHMEFPFRTSTPSQREIFSLTAVIVACSLCLNNNSSCERKYFTLGGCAGPERPLHTSRESKPQ